jgi:PTH2 family peptidyl-tRNA hydrolase
MAEDSDIRQIIVMRKDLGMRKGKMIAQGAHASLKVLLDRKSKQGWYGPGEGGALTLELTEPMKQWVEGIFTKICLQVSSEEELLQVYEAAKASLLPVALIQDAGLTEFMVPTYTCCAIGPAPKSDIDPITGHLKLL